LHSPRRQDVFESLGRLDLEQAQHVAACVCRARYFRQERVESFPNL
jgi:hypothetical protein